MVNRLLPRTLLALGLAGCAQVVDAPERQYDPTYQGSSPASSGPSDSLTKEELCKLYCRQAASVCTGDLSVYPSINACEATCLALPTGSSSDTSGNTVHCRRNYLDLASKSTDNAKLYCPSAGPGGGPAEIGEGGESACGTDCEGFCYLTDRICTGNNLVYENQSECLSACLQMKRRGPYSSKLDTTGNTLGCRLYHLTAAAYDPPGHCSHVKGDKNCNDADLKPAPSP